MGWILIFYIEIRILYDKNGKLAAMQRQYNVPYPDGLKDNIIQQNLRLLRGNLPS